MASERHQFWPTFGNPQFEAHPSLWPSTQSTVYEQRAACVAAQEGRRVRVCEGAPVDRRKRVSRASATQTPRFLDLKKAFDRVDRKLLWIVLGRFGVPPTLIQVIRKLYDGSTQDWYALSKARPSSPIHSQHWKKTSL